MKDEKIKNTIMPPGDAASQRKHGHKKSAHYSQKKHDHKKSEYFTSYSQSYGQFKDEVCDQTRAEQSCDTSLKSTHSKEYEPGQHEEIYRLHKYKQTPPTMQHRPYSEELHRNHSWVSHNYKKYDNGYDQTRAEQSCGTSLKSTHSKEYKYKQTSPAIQHSPYSEELYRHYSWVSHNYKKYDNGYDQTRAEQSCGTSLESNQNDNSKSTQYTYNSIEEILHKIKIIFNKYKKMGMRGCAAKSQSEVCNEGGKVSYIQPNHIQFYNDTLVLMYNILKNTALEDSERIKICSYMTKDALDIIYNKIDKQNLFVKYAPYRSSERDCVSGVMFNVVSVAGMHLEKISENIVGLTCDKNLNETLRDNIHTINNFLDTINEALREHLEDSDIQKGRKTADIFKGLRGLFASVLNKRFLPADLKRFAEQVKCFVNKSHKIITTFISEKRSSVLTMMEERKIKLPIKKFFQSSSGNALPLHCGPEHQQADVTKYLYEKKERPCHSKKKCTPETKYANPKKLYAPLYPSTRQSQNVTQNYSSGLAQANPEQLYTTLPSRAFSSLQDSQCAQGANVERMPCGQLQDSMLFSLQDSQRAQSANVERMPCGQLQDSMLFSLQDSQRAQSANVERMPCGQLKESVLHNLQMLRIVEGGNVVRNK